MNVDLISLSNNSIIKQQPGGAVVWNNAGLTSMTIIEPVTGWLEIVDIPMFDLNEVMSGNYEYIHT